MIARNEPEIREHLVADIKHQIAAGTYETPEKLEAAIDAFLDAHDAAESKLDNDASEGGPSRPR